MPEPKKDRLKKYVTNLNCIQEFSAVNQYVKSSHETWIILKNKIILKLA